MAVKPLAVAGVAAVLLVVVLGADLSMNRTYYVDAWTGEAWREIAQQPVRYDERMGHGLGVSTIEVNRTDEVRFRLRVDNGYAWDFAERYRVVHEGEEVASGTLTVPARSFGESEFTIDAERLLDTQGLREPKPEPFLQWANLVVEVDGEWLYPNVQLKEVARE